jgi:tetratricopeptide (TPR) repeat protein
MPTEPPLRYHQAIFDLIGERPLIIATSLAQVEAWERTEGRRLPPSLREWFSIFNGSLLLGRYSNEDHPEPLASRHLVCRAVWEGDWEEPAPPRLWVLAPPLMECGEFQILEVLEDPGYLKLITENQAVCHWYVHLAGEDPPVYNDQDGQPLQEWSKEGESFSSFLFDWFCDHRYPTLFGPRESHLVVAAETRLTREEELQCLRSAFREGPCTPEAASGWRYRFFDVDGCVRIRFNAPGDGAEVDAYWEVAAISDQALERFLGALWPLADFGPNVRPYYLLDERVEQVLAGLGWVKDKGVRDAVWHLVQAGTLRLRSAKENNRELLRRAIEEVNRGMELDPTRPDLYEERISCYDWLAEDAPMIPDYTSLIELDPGNRNYWLHARSMCYCRLQQFDQALDDLCVLVEIAPDYAYYAHDAELFSRAGREDLVRRLYECWRDHPPKSPWGRMRIEEYFAGKGEG